MLFQPLRMNWKNNKMAKLMLMLTVLVLFSTDLQHTLSNLSLSDLLTALCLRSFYALTITLAEHQKKFRWFQTSICRFSHWKSFLHHRYDNPPNQTCLVDSWRYCHWTKWSCCHNTFYSSYSYCIFARCPWNNYIYCNYTVIVLPIPKISQIHQ